MHVCTSLRSFSTFYPMNVSILDLLSQSATPVCTSTEFCLFFCSFSVFCGSFSFLFLVVVYFYTLAFSCNNFELLYCHFVALKSHSVHLSSCRHFRSSARHRSVPGGPASNGVHKSKALTAAMYKSITGMNCLISALFRILDLCLFIASSYLCRCFAFICEILESF